MGSTRLAPLSSEFSNTDLGDPRLTHRLMRVADAAEKAPGSSLPVRAGSSAALEATYRLLENERVSPEAVLASHVHCTVQRAQTHPQVLVLHDTTEYKFEGDTWREGLGWLSHERCQGFLSHHSFCVSPTGEPLGTLGLYAWSREGKPKGRRSRQACQWDPNRESLRWQESALLVGELLYDKTEAIHVMDREGDCYELMSTLVEHEQRFIIRLCHDRRLEPGRKAGELPMLFESLSSAPLLFEREVVLSPRGKQRGGRQRKTFPARAKRLAQLEVRAESKEIFIGNGAPAHVFPSLTLQFVEVREVCPPEGQEPVVWRLVTTQPVETKEQAVAVVDAYRQRWLIEEFFKAVKTGCKYQQHQLESSRTLLVDLTIEIAVAWRMLLVRWLANNQPEAPASYVVTETHLAILVALDAQQQRKFPDDPTVENVMHRIAALGGHIKNNGPPGWLVLRRGFEKLLAFEIGWVARELIPEKM